MPVVSEQTEQSVAAEPKSQTNLLLDNVSKIECKLVFTVDFNDSPRMLINFLYSIFGSNGENTVCFQIRSSSTKSKDEKETNINNIIDNI